MSPAMLIHRIGEKAAAPLRQPAPRVTIQEIRKALAGSLKAANPNSAHVLARLQFALTNLEIIEARRMAGTSRPGDEADFAAYEKQIADDLRKLGLFAVEAAS